MKVMKPCLIALTLSTLGITPAVDAAGKKPTNPDTPKFTTPFPLRPMILEKVGTKPFQLPNGTTVNLSADLLSMLGTSVNSTQVFAPATLTTLPTGPCDYYLTIQSNISTLDLDVAEFGIKIGYTPNGQLGPVTGISGSAKVRVGTIAMDFKARKCNSKECVDFAAVTASHATAGVNLDFTVDFSMIKIGPDFIYNTPLGPIIRKIMDKGMAELAKAPFINTLDWQARVREYIPGVGMLIFDAGAQSRIATNQAFTVLSPIPADAALGCTPFHSVARAHSTQIEQHSSVALVDEILDNSRGIREGDIVQIHYLELNP